MSANSKKKANNRPAGDGKNETPGDAGNASNSKVPNSEDKTTGDQMKLTKPVRGRESNKEDKLDLILNNVIEVNKKVDQNSKLIKKQQLKQKELEETFKKDKLCANKNRSKDNHYAAGSEVDDHEFDPNVSSFSGWPHNQHYYQDCDEQGEVMYDYYDPEG